MTKKEILYGLYALVHDRESFLTGDKEYDEVFLKDIEVLNVAINMIKNMEEE